MQNGAADVPDDNAQALQIDAYTKEIEEIADMLDALKDELERKERLLIKVEETLEDTEKVLEKKIQSIVEKDEKVKKIEDILKRKEEDMRIQEEELQTNAALEYLSFREREDEISERMAEITDKESTIKSHLTMEEMDQQIKDREEFLKQIEERIKEAGTKEAATTGNVDPRLMEEIEQREDEIRERAEDLQDMQNRLINMEEELRDREEELMLRTREIREHAGGEGAAGAATAAGGAPDPQLTQELQRKELEIQQLKKKLTVTGKETKDSKKNLEEMEIQLKEREEELRYKENEIDEERKKLQEQIGMDKGELAQLMANEQEIKYQIEREIKKKERELQDKITRKSDLRIQPLLKKIELLTKRNEELETLEDDLEGKRADLEMREMQLRERFEEISFGEEKLGKREERLMNERMSLEEERKKAKSAGKGGDYELMEEELRLKNEELRQVEEQLSEREQFLREKEQEMKRMESKVINAELDMEFAVEKEKDAAKIKTGVRRLDDLLYGGLPLSSNIFIYGPPFTGKLVLLNLFVSESLRKGIPGVFILTDKTPSEIREGLKLVLPKVDVYEKKGLLKYVDAYSRSMDIDKEEANTVYVDKATNLDEISLAVSNLQDEISKEHKHHKIAFHSVSTIMAYTDAMTTFRFLQNLTSRNKRSKAITMYCMDHGMFKDSEVQTLKHLMNGIIEFKIDDLKSYMRVEGIGDVRTRGWIEYSHTTKSLNLKGSFAVDHIR
jgi:KaiC/GvpD/RAD55 family RecA-like ATPase